MKKINIEQLKKIQLDILRDVDDFCAQNNIKYFMCGGTLLGAVRHKGYIPWDDDIDIMMPRKDFEHFVKKYSQSDRKYQVKAFEKDSDWVFPFAKILAPDTCLIEDVNDNSSLSINIDLFPIDTLNEDENLVSKIISKNIKLIKLLMLKRLKISRRHNILKNIVLIILQLLLKPFSARFIGEKIVKNAKCASSEKGKKIACLVWGYGFKEVIDAENLKQEIRLDFENNKFAAPIGYKAY